MVVQNTKDYKKMIRNLTLLTLSVLFFWSCSSPFVVQEVPDNSGSGALTVKFIIPDYRAITESSESDSRIIDSNTSFIRLYLNDELNREVDINYGTMTNVAFGVEWSAAFSVPVPLSGVYDKIELVLLDSERNMLTRGMKNNIAVVENSTIQLSIGCLPYNLVSINFIDGFFTQETLDIEAGYTNYFSFNAIAERSYMITASGGPGSDPDIFLFDSTGRYIDGSAVSGESTEELIWISGAASSVYFGLTAETEGTYTIEVEGYNQAPIVYAGDNITSDANVEVTFIGMANDPEGSTMTFEWDFGDDSTASGQTVTHIYSDESTIAGYPVTLTVTDSGGGIGVDTLAAYILSDNVPPVADASTDQIVIVEDIVAFNASGSYDPNAGDTLTYSWDFGDGSAIETGITTTHSYAAAGDYTVTLTVTDNDMAASTSTMVVTVNANTAPVAISGPDIETISGNTVTFDGSASYDAEDHDLTWSWDFGDGTSGITGTSVTHIYADPGAYIVTLSVTDSKGDIDTDVLNVLITEEFSFNLTIDPGTIVTESAPIVLAFVDWEMNGNAVYLKKVTAGGIISVNTREFNYQVDRDYILLLIHDSNNNAEIGLVSTLLDDAVDFTGLYYAGAEGSILYDFPLEVDFVLASALVVPGVNYDISFEDKAGDLTIIVQ